MLRRLSVENYALIDRLDIEWAPGLNIITGETGAGKSILLGALGLILGSRADASVIKDTERNCVIEGEFDISRYDLAAYFEEQDIDYDPQTLVRRVITPAGKSRAYVNDIPVQLTVLRDLGARLIDIHSQHQTLLLSDSRFQIGLVDSVAAHGDLLKRYRGVFDRLNRGCRELAEFRKKADENRKDIEYLTYQFEQLQAAKLCEGEQAELERILSEQSHVAEIKEVLAYASESLNGDEDSLLARLKSLELSVGRLQEIYPRAGEFYTRLHGAMLDLKDLASEAASEAERVDADPQLLERTGQRLDLIYTLQQKHRVSSVEELIGLRQEYEERLKAVSGNEEAIAALEKQNGVLQTEAVKLAAGITAGRKRTVPSVEKQVAGMLAELGMPAAQLKIEITPAAELGPEGGDAVRFLFTANRNMPLQPIEKVASGGEMSRLMLSLKALVARHADLPTIIFDEIDTGISGAVADKMGGIIFRLSDDLQVINITHLPQVASKGDTHFFVYKEESGGITSTRLRRLRPSERVDEIAKMLSVSDVTSAAREQARLLLGGQS